MKAVVNRAVDVLDKHNYLGRSVEVGETFYVFRSATYGCINTSGGVALSQGGPTEYPFFEFPIDAIDIVCDDSEVNA